MKKWRITVFIVIPLLLFALVYNQCQPSGDKVALANTSGSENGILVNAQAGSGVLLDKAFTSTADTIKVGQLTASPGRNEVIAFTRSRPVSIQSPAAWTSGTDTINLAFADEIEIAITIWILKGPFAAQSQAATNRCVDIVAMWNAERMGVKLADGGCDVRDATSNPEAQKYLAFQCSQRPDLQGPDAIPPVQGRINMYIVDTVQGVPSGTGNGNSCGTTDFVALGSTGSAGLAAHELGHNFSLTHIDDLPEFDEDNIMHSASDTRQYFTEGQLFRAHFARIVPSDPYLPSSALNTVYEVPRAGQIPNCAIDPCPALEKRIWADGALAPN
jgi:hypothetical protein